MRDRGNINLARSIFMFYYVLNLKILRAYLIPTYCLFVILHTVSGQSGLVSESFLMSYK